VLDENTNIFVQRTPFHTAGGSAVSSQTLGPNLLERRPGGHGISLPPGSRVGVSDYSLRLA
jgi:hypothetical protein